MGAHSNSGCGGRGAQHGDGIESGHPSRFVIILKKSRNKEEREQFEERAADSGMDEAVGEGLPESAVQERAGSECEGVCKPVGGGRSGHQRQSQGEVGRQVPQNQAARGAAEVGEGKRSGAESGHSLVSG